MPHRLIEPATWFAEPGAEGISFDTFAKAVLHAMDLPRNDRHRRANIVTQSGSIYGWDAIEAIFERL